MVVARFLAAVCVVLLLAHAAAAGSDKNPEIVDDANDQKVTVQGMPSPVPTCGPAGQPSSCVYIPADILSAWFEASGGNLTISVNVAQAPPSTFGDIAYSVGFSAGGTAYVATATVKQAAPAGDGSTSASGVATSAEVSGTWIVMTVPFGKIPAATPGTNLTQVFATSSGTGGPSGEQDVSDRAPSTGFGRDFPMPAAGSPKGNSTAPPPTSTGPKPSGNNTVPPPGLPPVTPPPSPTTKASPLNLDDTVAGLLLGMALVCRRAKRPNLPSRL